MKRSNAKKMYNDSKIETFHKKNKSNEEASVHFHTFYVSFPYMKRSVHYRIDQPKCTDRPFF